MGAQPAMASSSTSSVHGRVAFSSMQGRLLPLGERDLLLRLEASILLLGSLRSIPSLSLLLGSLVLGLGSIPSSLLLLVLRLGLLLCLSSSLRRLRLALLRVLGWCRSFSKQLLSPALITLDKCRPRISFLDWNPAAEIYPATVYGRKCERASKPFEQPVIRMSVDLYFGDFPSLPVISDLSDDGSDIFSIDDGLLKTADSMDAGCIHAKDREAARSEIAVCVRVAEVAQKTKLSVGVLLLYIRKQNIGIADYVLVQFLWGHVSRHQFLRKHLSTDGGCDKHMFLSKTVPADIDMQIQLEDKWNREWKGSRILWSRLLPRRNLTRTFYQSSTNPSVASGIPGSVAVSLTTAAGKTLLRMCCIVQWDLNGNLNYQKAGKTGSKATLSHAYFALLGKTNLLSDF
ncbi:hypothetical protein SELMODRAFT_403911 [Selaginella moellendorffii]|uniref:Uncharacterized protein n=1 Tax=Selaginella moellendorffii TaxID=88036 RepID=D8QSY7_SELML|nr:hypothetical protein SELMODRAFT_403911 [Selaginella moellendorffii]